MIVDATAVETSQERKQEILEKLKQSQGLDQGASPVETPVGTLDFSVDTEANGTATVQLYLEDNTYINRIFKTTNLTDANPEGEAFEYNSEIITYTGEEADFDSWLDGLSYNLYYYDQPHNQDPNNPLTIDLSVGKDTNIDDFFHDNSIPSRHWSIIDGSAYLIDKGGDGDID